MDTGNKLTVSGVETARLSMSYRPKLRFYHPNAKGTGCALALELHPAHGDVDGSIWMSVANQLTIGDHSGPAPTFPRFDWENRITVKLDFSDLCRILQVLRGECESIEDGRGLFHRTAMATTRIVFRHLVEPVQGYSLEIFKSKQRGNDEHSHFVFRDWEALGLSEAISGSMSVISFGLPKVVVRNDEVLRAKENGRRGNVCAA